MEDGAHCTNGLVSVEDGAHCRNGKRKHTAVQEKVHSSMPANHTTI